MAEHHRVPDQQIKPTSCHCLNETWKGRENFTRVYVRILNSLIEDDSWLHITYDRQCLIQGSAASVFQSIIIYNIRIYNYIYVHYTLSIWQYLSIWYINQVWLYATLCFVVFMYIYKYTHIYIYILICVPQCSRSHNYPKTHISPLEMRKMHGKGFPKGKHYICYYIYNPSNPIRNS